MRKLVAATTLVVCLGLAPAATAAAPPGFYGVVAGKFDPSPPDLQRMAAGKVGALRVNLAWASVQTNGPGPFDWSRYDNLIGATAENGIKVLPTVYGTPGWAAARPNHPPKPAYIDEFETFLRAAVERYGPDGTFWTLNPTLPKLPITDWQLFNEVNSPTFWLPKPKAKQYKRLLAAANRAINGVDPKARIILAGLFTIPRIKNGVTLEDYLTDLYHLKARKLFDAVAVHPYARTPRRALAAVEEARAVMRKFKDKKKPIWLTEVGWATAGQTTPLTVKLGTQAKYLRQTYNLAAAKRNRLKIAGVFWYTFKDLPSSIWIDNTGLFTTTGAPKPAWNAFVGLTGGTP